MNFEEMSAEDLIDSLPGTDEDSRWELKSAQLLTQKDELKKALGKQVSAFANSGGGYLVFGVNGVTRALEACPTEFGRQSAADYLSTMVSQSVDHPLTDFRIHRLKMESGGCIFVVAIGDSPAAPHQSKADLTYYYRIHGHSKPAPHFHLELLRNRMTKAVLAIENVDYAFQLPTRSPDELLMLNVAVTVQIRNASLQSATSWGVHAARPGDNRRWRMLKTGTYLCDGTCVRGEQPTLLPDERATVIIHLTATASPDEGGGLGELLRRFRVQLRPVSQNHLGDISWLEWSTPSELNAAEKRLDRFLSQNGMRL